MNVMKHGVMRQRPREKSEFLDPYRYVILSPFRPKVDEMVDEIKSDHEKTR